MANQADELELQLGAHSLEVVCAQLPVAAIAMQAFHASCSCFLTRVKVFAVPLAAGALADSGAGALGRGPKCCNLALDLTYVVKLVSALAHGDCSSPASTMLNPRVMSK